MFKSNSVIIVGAGASYEIGMPVGDELKGEIAELVNIKFPDGYTQRGGDYRITEALKRIVEKEGKRDINPYLHACWHINEALPQAISIDNFLDSQDSGMISTVGKLGITRAILNKERSSKLYFDERRGEKALDFKGVTNTWYHNFFQLLVEGLKRKDVEEIFKNISIISFNYDRSIEHFLFNAIQNYFRVDAQISGEILSTLRIFHPYGTTGKLPWQKGSSPSITFGADRDYDLSEVFSTIKTFTEQVDDPDFLISIRNCIIHAKHLIFVGFAFHDANMDLLQPEEGTQIERVFATAYRISDSDCMAISERIGKLCLGEAPNWDWADDILELRNALTAADLFREFGRSLRA